MSTKRPTAMNEGPPAFSRFREAMKSIVSVPKKNLQAKAKGKQCKSKHSTIPIPTA